MASSISSYFHRCYRLDMNAALRQWLTAGLLVLEVPAALDAESLDLSQALTLAVQRSGKLGSATAAVAQTGALVQANQMGASLTDVLPQLRHLCLLCAGYLLLAAWALNRAGRVRPIHRP